MPHFSSVTSHANKPEANAKPAISGGRRRQSKSPDFFASMYASLTRAQLGRFFGVAPPVARSRTNVHNVPEQTGDGDNAETRQAKDIYQAMLDITGH
jgi:hypothetical protein|tara:strand:- start:371 stop:661 length:291 start_codon:yes stop_codon:yes gene_type:complete